MKRAKREWSELLRSLGGAFGDVVAAELGALRDDFARDGKNAGIGAGLVLAACALGAWSLGVVTALAIAVLAIWLPVWASIGIVLLVILIVMVVLLLVARNRFRRLEGPTNTVQRRWEDLRRWWNERVLGEPAPRPALEEEEVP